MGLKLFTVLAPLMCMICIRGSSHDDNVKIYKYIQLAPGTYNIRDVILVVENPSKTSNCVR